MEENLHNDQLERFFRKELADLEDTPQTDFWGELADKIPPKPKKKRAFILPFWQYGVAASLIGILFFSVWQWANYKNEMNQMANTIELQNQNIENLNTKIDGLENITDNNPSYIEDELPIEETDKNDKQLIANTTEKNKNKIKLNNNLQKQKVKTNDNKNLAYNKLTVNDKTIKSTNKQINSPFKNTIEANSPNQNPIKQTDQLITNKGNKSAPIEGFEKMDKIAPVLIAENDLPLNLIPIRGLKNPVPLEKQPSHLDENLLDIIALTTSTEVLKKPGISKGFFTGFRFAPTIAHRIVRHPDKDVKRKIDEKEKIGFDYSLGLELGYSFNKNWSIVSGIGYTVENQLLRHKNPSPLSFNFDEMQGFSTLSSYGDIKIDAELSPSNTVGIPPLQNSIDVNAELKGNIKVEFVNIPLLAEYRFGWKKFRIALKTGFALESIARISVNIKELEDKDNENQQLAFKDDKPHKINHPPKLVHFNWIVGAGLYYAINDKVNIYLEPYAKGGLTPAFRSKGTKTYPYSFALNTGFRWYL